MQVNKYVFQSHGDERGQLVALEEFRDIPFRIKRVYYMHISRSNRSSSASTAVARLRWTTDGKRRLCRWNALMKDCM